MKPKSIPIAASVAAALTIAAIPPAAGQHSTHEHSPQLGKVNFPVDCNPQAQQAFNLAMAYYHSFAWRQIRDAIDQVQKADASCGMAHWLRALSLLDNPFTWPIPLTPKTMSEASAALDQARQAGLKSQRERDYVDALGTFFAAGADQPHRARAKALEEALERVAQRYPDDKEAAILHALVVSVNFDPTDQQFRNQLRAASILEPIFKEQPEHPGVAHYLIHSYDYPPIAHHGLDAARRYARIAASAPHAQHMPSHIFTRVGAWQDSVESNLASAAAAPPGAFERAHAYDYMAYAHLQMAQDDGAQKAIALMREVKPAENFAYAFAAAAIPARLALERERWDEAARLELSPPAESFAWKRFPQAEAINAFARGLGAAMLNDAPAVQAQLDRLGRLRDAMAAMKQPYWVEQIEIQSEVVRGLALATAGKGDEAVATLRRAADREDATQKHVVTPGPLVPAREALGYRLLEQGKAAEALQEFETTLKREPNRFRTVAGALQAAEQAGNRAKAAEHAARLLQIASKADSERPQLAKAKALAQR